MRIVLIRIVLNHILRIPAFLWIVFTLFIGPEIHGAVSPVPRNSGPIDQEVYVWQRSWSGPVQDSISQVRSDFSSFIVLGAEVSFKDGDPEIFRVPIDYQSLSDSDITVGIAIRIGPFSGDFSDEGTSRLLCEIASSLIGEAESKGIALREIQIDFDAAESKLDGYRLWLSAIRTAIEPVPLTITALPSWMGCSGFSRLIRSTDGFVLQVHSLEPPDGIDSNFTLLNPERSLAWVERASRLCPEDIGFRVALPTYGYTVAFDSDGKFFALSAEGPDPDWPDGTRTREVIADPDEISALVEGWIIDRPWNLEGLIWYRMPVETDRLNWPWQTLRAVMNGRAPYQSLNIRTESNESGLIDFYLVNDGETSEKTDVLISINWQDADLLAFDLLRDFTITDRRPGTVILQGPISDARQPSNRIGPGESWMVSWLRFDHEIQVQTDVSEVTQ